MKTVLRKNGDEYYLNGPIKWNEWEMESGKESRCPESGRIKKVSIEDRDLRWEDCVKRDTERVGEEWKKGANDRRNGTLFFL